MGSLWSVFNVYRVLVLLASNLSVQSHSELIQWISDFQQLCRKRLLVQQSDMVDPGALVTHTVKLLISAWPLIKAGL